RGDKRVVVFVREDPLEDRPRVFVLFPPDGGWVVDAGRGDDPLERLATGPHAGEEHVTNVAVFVRVQLVEDRGMRIEAVEGVGIGAQRLELRIQRRDAQVVAVDLDESPELRRPAYHLHCGVMDDPRLVFLRRGGVYLRPLLAIGDEEVERDRCGELGLAILPRNLDVGRAEAAGSVGAPPAEDRTDDLLLPLLEEEWAAGPLPLMVAAERLDEMHDPIR